MDGCADRGDSFLGLVPLGFVVDHVDGVAGVEVTVDVVLARKGVDGFDVGELETGDLKSGFCAELGGVVEERAVGCCFCVPACEERLGRT